MTYQEAHDYFFALNNLAGETSSITAKHAGVYLKRMQALLDVLGNPEKKIKHYAHITGTSGKGSVCMILASMLAASDKKVGLLTSPHPSILTERWQVNGRSMSQAEFVEIMAFVKPKLDKYIQTTPYETVTFFEITTIVGLLYFARKKVDWAVIEVGCGGRYDSTNIMPHKDVAIITNIGLDHTHILGGTKELIAYEKAGIIKKNNLVFTQEEEVSSIIAFEAKKQKAQLNILREADHQYEIIRQDFSGLEFIYKAEKFRINNFGLHQIKNAILCINVAQALNINLKAIKSGLAKTEFPIRLEVVSQEPVVILDGAHNPDKIKATIDTVNALQAGYKKLHLVLGFSDNKDHANFAKGLIALNPASVSFTRFTANPFRRTANPKLLGEALKKKAPLIKVNYFLDPVAALTWSQKQAKKNDLILVTGSMFLAGELRLKFKKIK